MYFYFLEHGLGPHSSDGVHVWCWRHSFLEVRTGETDNVKMYRSKLICKNKKNQLFKTVTLYWKFLSISQEATRNFNSWKPFIKRVKPNGKTTLMNFYPGETFCTFKTDVANLRREDWLEKDIFSLFISLVVCFWLFYNHYFICLFNLFSLFDILLFHHPMIDIWLFYTFIIYQHNHFHLLSS